MKLKSAILVLLHCILFLGCITKAKQEREVDSFDVFYEKFHSDTAFQLSRVVFPLPGVNTEEMSVLDSVYFWEREDWEYHQKPKIDASDEYGIDIQKTDSVVEEVIYSKIPGFVFKREFKKIDGEWYLVRLESVI
jgi:hypothetical protein